MAIQSITNRSWPVHLVAILALLNVASPFAKASQPTSTWTTGHKKILVIPVRFTDANGPTNADVNGSTGWNNFTNGATQTQINEFMLKQSYGQLSVEFTVLPLINLGVSTNYYTNTCPGTTVPKWTAWGAPGSLADDARAKARAMGLTNGQAAKFESANYDFDIIATGYMLGRQGSESDGGRGVMAYDYFNALPHEICHCLGLQHANGYSRATLNYPMTNNNTALFHAYADVYCLMGWKENTRTPTPDADRDANTYFKFELGWLTTNHIGTPSTSGVYRVYAFDQGAVTPGTNYALRIPRDSGHTYWFDFRQAITNAPDAKWSQNGLEVHYGADNPQTSSGATILWDTTPGTRGPVGSSFATMHDAPLAIGRTWTDPGANLHVTPFRKGGTSPESLDVQVNFGPFPGNQAPTISISPTNLTLGAGVGQTFTATASDPDGDTLSYYWEFDDNQTLGGTDFGGVNGDARFATNGFHMWSQNGTNFVRCTVSDMKGHTKTVSAVVNITNGLPAPVTISGIVKDELGNPLAGAIVNNFLSGVPYGTANFAGSSVTAADGKYLINIPVTNLPYRSSVMWQGYTFTNSSGFVISTNTVFASNIGNVNFTRKRMMRTISGQVYLAGHGYQSGTYGDLWVSDGHTNLLITSGGWQLDVPDGASVSLTATATNPLYQITSDFPNPYPVVNDCNVLHFFVSGPDLLPLASFASAGTNSDDTVGTVNIPVNLSMPTGWINWFNNLSFFCAIDPSSTAQYGVDYKMNGASLTFYGGLAPEPLQLPLTIIHDGVPKNKTLVLKLTPGSSVSFVTAPDTFTYTISNPPLAVSAVSVSNGVFNLIWPAVSAAHYTIESTPTLSPPAWTSRAPHTNLTGVDGTMARSIILSGATNEFFRVRVE